MVDPNEANEILREFCADVLAAYGNDEWQVKDRLAAEWPDLAITWAKAQAYVNQLD